MPTPSFEATTGTGDGTRRPSSADVELDRERTYGGPGIEHDVPIPVIALGDRAPDRIDDELWDAAADVGFFQLVDHGIARADVDEAFGLAAAFFDLPDDVKRRRALPAGSNSGWEYRSQLRPSTGTLDHKESYQVTTSRMERFELWPSDDELASFRAVMERFEATNWALAMRVLSSFARKLGLADDFFTIRHDRTRQQYQSTLRLLHYLPVDAEDLDPAIWRAGAHTDFDCLTLLHQVPGQGGLQVSRGRDGETDELRWTSVEPVADRITCNIGDMLVRWSDDALRSTLHRVRMPRPDEYLGPRYSLAYFAQADTDALIQGPAGRYEPVTAADYLQQRIAANFAARG